MKEEVKEKVKPFEVWINSIQNGLVYILLPSTLDVGDKKINLKHTLVCVDPGKNERHNIRRDVRRLLREKYNVCVSFKEQNETIIIKNNH